MAIPGLVLAAGRSRRMGRPKALLPAGDAGDTFVGRIVRTLRAAGVDEIVVVAGDLAPEIASALAGEAHPPRVVVNPEPGRGQFSSLQTGLRAVNRPGIRGVLATLVDVPLVTAGTVAALLAAHAATAAPIVRPGARRAARSPGDFRSPRAARDSRRAAGIHRQDDHRRAPPRVRRCPDRRGRPLHRHRHTRRVRGAV